MGTRRSNGCVGCAEHASVQRPGRAEEPRGRTHNGKREPRGNGERAVRCPRGSSLGSPPCTRTYTCAHAPAQHRPCSRWPRSCQWQHWRPVTVGLHTVTSHTAVVNPQTCRAWRASVNFSGPQSTFLGLGIDEDSGGSTASTVCCGVSKKQHLYRRNNRSTSKKHMSHGVEAGIRDHC